MANYCVHCGSATRNEWFCEHCGASPANPWPTAKPALTESLTPDRVQPDEIRPVTALFADIVGSTALGERLTPEDVKGLVGECVSRMSSAIESYGGIVTSYMGDGVAAFFGLEAAREDDATRAGLAALRIVSAVAECSAEVEAAWGVKELAVRVGLNSGRVGTGMVGGSHPQLLALGDAVNVAARLQAAASPGSVLVGPRTAAKLTPLFDLEVVGTLELKGRERAVEAWRLTNYVGERSGVEGYRTRFVGRGPELRALDVAMAELRQGRSRIVALVGEAGIGKTRLLAEAYTRCPEEIQWLRARCFDHAVDAPLGPFVNLLREWLGLTEDTPRAVARVRAVARMSGVVDDRALNLLCRLLSLDVPRDAEEGLRHLAPRALWTQIRESCVEWVREVARSRPLVLVVDDFDRADDLTVELVGKLLPLTDVFPISMVLALRPEPQSSAWATLVQAHAEHSHRVSEVRLLPLAMTECEEMVALLDPENRLSAEVRLSAVSQAEGNPLFVEEITHEALERGMSADLRRQIAILPLPSSLEALLLARVDRLPGPVRLTAQFGALCGRRFVRRVIEGVVGPERVAHDVPTLLRAGLLREDGLVPDQAYAFTHGLIREAVLGTITPERLAAMHHQLAASLEALPDFADRLPLLATHYAASTDKEKALEYLEKAADHATDKAFIADAIEKYRAGLDLTVDLNREDDLFRLSEKLAQLYSLVGRFDAALGIWNDLLARASTTDEAARIRIRMARVLFDSGEFDTMAEVCAEVGANIAPTLQAELLYLQARFAIRTIDYAKAHAHLQQARELPDAEISPSVKGELATAWGCFYVATGAFEKAKESATRGLAIANSLGDGDMILRTRRDLGTIYLVMGELGAARAELEDVYETSRELGNSTRALDVASNLINIYTLAGDVRRGVKLGRELLMWVRNPFWRSALLVNLAELEAMSGDRASARVHLRQGREVAGDGLGSQVTRVLSQLVEADLLCVEDVGRAEEIANEVLREADEDGIRPDLEVAALVVRGTAALITHRIDLANADAQRALELSEDLGAGTRLDAVAFYGLTSSVVEPRRAEPMLWEALETSRRYGMRITEARVLFVLGMCLKSESYCADAERIVVECEALDALATGRHVKSVLESAFDRSPT